LYELPVYRPVQVSDDGTVATQNGYARVCLLKGEHVDVLVAAGSCDMGAVRGILDVCHWVSDSISARLKKINVALPFAGRLFVPLAHTDSCVRVHHGHDSRGCNASSLLRRNGENNDLAIGKPYN
jgi:hypothetical protein